MTDATIKSMICEALYARMSNNVMFTAFDVTLSIQHRLKQLFLFDATKHKHKHLRAVIHECMNDPVGTGKYGKGLKDVGAPKKAWVYHPVGADPQSYVALHRQPGTPKPNKNKNIPIPTNIGSPVKIAAIEALANIDGPINVQASQDFEKVKFKFGEPDGRGTIAIPGPLVKAIGLGPGDTAFVSFVNNKLCVSKEFKQPNVTKYTVNLHHNVRITKSTFEFVELKSNYYEFEKVENCIYIKPATKPQNDLDLFAS